MTDPRRARPYRRLGARVRAARLEARLTQVELARRVHIAQTYLSNIELGQNRPDVEVLHRLARALHISAPELLLLAGYTESPRPGETFTIAVDPEAADDASWFARLPAMVRRSFRGSLTDLQHWAVRHYLPDAEPPDRPGGETDSGGDEQVE